MHCHQAAVKEPLKDSQGFSLLLRLWPWHKLVGGGQTTCMQWQRNFVVRPGLGTEACAAHTLVNIPHNFSGAKKSPMRRCVQSQCSSIVGQSAAVSTGAQPGGNETLCRRRQKMPLIPRLSIKHLKLHSAQLGAATEWVYVGKRVSVTNVFSYATSASTIMNHPAQRTILWDVFVAFLFFFFLF